VEAGKIDLNTTLVQLGIDDIGGLSDLEKKATIKDLLTARSGVYHPASNPGDAARLAPPRGSVQPGTRWLYNNWDFNVAGYILEQLTGKSIYYLVDSLLAGPLRMQDWDLSAQRKGGDLTKSKYPAYHMWFSTRDMARIGYLMLRNGKWENRQLVAAGWVKTITTVVTSHREAVESKTAFNHFAYGYLWWLWDEAGNSGAYEGAYTAMGAGGQFITVLPKLDLVIAFKTNNTGANQTSTARYLLFLNKLLSCRN
jgi:CubicO group peptidase (beta-lactamase class C family)